MWPVLHLHPNSWHKFIDQYDSNKNHRTSPLNIISIMCQERSKSTTKYLQTGCSTYRPDLLFCRMLLDVYFVTSKFGLLNVNDFSLINFTSLNANLKLLNKNVMLLNTNFKLVSIKFLKSHLLNIKIICWIYKSYLLTMKTICWNYKNNLLNMKIICWK